MKKRLANSISGAATRRNGGKQHATAASLSPLHLHAHQYIIMVALFSSLLSSRNEDSAAVSSSSIPTVIQLYTSTPLQVHSSSKLAGHALLSYQAVEVHEPSEETQETTLFGRKTKSSTSMVETPNLGVWNVKVLGSGTVVDSLLKIPSSPYYCMTVDLFDPSQVEPCMTRMQEALVRFLIACPPAASKNEGSMTSLYNLRMQTFGLAPNDTPPSTSAAAEEGDRHVCVHVMICAVTPKEPSSDYQTTQAQNLVTYHLRRFAAAIGATLVFVSTNPVEKSENDKQDTDNAENLQTALSISQLAHVWREWAQGNDVVKEQEDSAADTSRAIYPPHSQDELIETVLLRNANNPPAWDSSKDSLWKALPAKKEEANGETRKTTQSSGDDGWLQQLRDSLGMAAEPTAAAPTTTTPAKTDDAEVSSFFENLLKK